MAKITLRAAVVLSSCALLVSCMIFTDSGPESKHLFESRLDASGAEVSRRELLDYDGTDSLRGVDLYSHSYAAGASRSIFDLTCYLCPVVDHPGDETTAEAEYSRKIFSFEASGSAFGLAIDGIDILALDPTSVDRGLLVSGGRYGEARLCSFLNGPKLGATAKEYESLSGEPREPLGIWAIPGSGYLTLAYDSDHGATIASYLDESLDVHHARIVENSRIDAIVGIAAEGRALVLEKDSPTDYRAYRLDPSGADEEGPIEISLPPSLGGASPVWAGDRFWFRAGLSLADLGLDCELGQVRSIAEAEALDPLYETIGMADAGIAIVGPVDLSRLDSYSGSFPMAMILRALRYDRDGTLMYRATIDYGTEKHPGTDYLQALILDATDASGELSILVQVDTWAIDKTGRRIR